MARRNAGMGVCVCCIMMVVVGMIVGRPAAAQAPAPSVDCTTVVLTLSDCLGFVTGTDKSPPAACCTELASVVKSSPQCLCLLFNTTFVEPLGVNITLAQELPTKCKVQTPSTSLCALVGIPVAAPASSTTPVMAPSPATKTPALSPTAPSSAPTPTTASSPSPTVAAPSGSIAPVGSPTAMQPNVSSVAPSAPNSAHSIGSRSGGAVASLLLLASIFLS